MTTCREEQGLRRFAMPAEWAPHEAVWTGWPADDDLWVGELEGVRVEFAVFIRALARFERVELIVGSDEAERDAESRLSGARIRVHRVPHDDVWLRDSGPIFVTDGHRVRLLNWIFNGWGGKYAAQRDSEIPHHVATILGTTTEDIPVVLEGGSIEVNGAGTVLTTRQCLLTPTRNPDMTEQDLEQVLQRRLGVSQVIWLDEGLEGDHTDGHIDTIARFTDTHTIVTVVSDDPDDTNYDPMQANLDRLRSAPAADGRPFTVVPLPLPRRRREFEGVRLPLTYANFYVANGGVLVPIYGDAHDERALEILRPLFPGREVVGLMVRHLITGGGAFHCVTQQQPAGALETTR
jgi:agmatine deiminase